MMRRLPAHPLPNAGDAGRLERDAERHARVLRLGSGDEVELFDGLGRRVRAVLRTEGKGLAYLVLEELPPRAPLPPRALLLGLPKGPVLDLCVRMATELGVTAVHLALTERSVPRLEGGRGEAKLERLRRIATEAARQCERDLAPRVEAPGPLLEAAGAIEANLPRFVACARGDAPLLEPAPAGAAVAIGPEGGFTDVEIDGLVDAGFAPASLGRTILRVPTAVAASLARLAY